MSIKIIKPGICSTIQDMGRTGYRSLGIGTSGVMDFFAATVANYLAGNNDGQPVIEMHFPAAEILFEQDAIISIAGADFAACINNEPVQIYQPIFVKKDDTLSFKKNITGARVYVGIQGGMEAQKWLGSYSTNIKVTAGGFKGRVLQKEDVIGIKQCNNTINNKKVTVAPAVIDSVYNHTNIIRCIAAPEWSLVSDLAANSFLQLPYTITNQSDRMGYRMAGEAINLQNQVELISSPVSFGTIQLLPNGQLIILMADHQTTGGYPRIANVTAADLPKLAQLPGNSTIHFKMVSLVEAEEMLLSIHKILTEIKTGCQNFYGVH
jgi:antagonist of KipI